MENQNIDTSKLKLQVLEVDISKLHPNPWNPNKEDEKVFRSVKNSIEKYGLINYPIVRENPEYYNEGEFEIIGGEHRWKACKELGYEMIKVNSLGSISVEDAKTLTLLLNIGGENDAVSEAELLKELQSQQSIFPYTEQEIKNKLDLLNFDFSQYEREETEKVKRDKSLVIPLTDKEELIIKHAFKLTKKNKDIDALMIIIDEYLSIRGKLEDIIESD